MFTKKTFSVAVLTLALATAGAFAQIAETPSGVTSVALSSALLGALSSLNVTPGVLNPTTLSSKGVVTFPITGGAIDAKTAVGQITHSGGLTLTAGKTEVTIQDFIIDTTGSAPVITGLASVNGSIAGSIPLFDLKLPSTFKLPIHPIDGAFVQIKGVDVTLSSTAAATLNKVFGVTAFTAGFDIGTANVQAFVVVQ